MPDGWISTDHVPCLPLRQDSRRTCLSRVFSIETWGSDTLLHRRLAIFICLLFADNDLTHTVKKSDCRASSSGGGIASISGSIVIFEICSQVTKILVGNHAAAGGLLLAGSPQARTRHLHCVR